METTEFKLEGLTCEACAKLASIALKKIGGIVEVNVDNGGNTKVIGDHVISKTEIESALINTNYKIAQIL